MTARGSDRRPLRILYVVSQWGAPTQTFVRREAQAARAAGNDIVVLSLKPPVPTSTPGESVVHLRVQDVLALARVLLRHPVRAGGALARAALGSKPSTLIHNVGATVIGLAATCRLPDVDWIHAHFAWVSASAADAISAARGQPYSIFAHAFDVFDDRFIDRYTRCKLERASIVVVESPSIMQEVNERFRCEATVARMGVPSEMVLEDPWRRQPEVGCIVSVGSLVPKKGHDVLVRALAMLRGDVRLDIAGDGPERRSLEALARELGVADRVQLRGAISEHEVSPLLDRASLFCLASRPTQHGDRDGVPNVLIEAMARAVPCVSTEVSGIPDLLEKGCGVVVPAGDAGALARALQRLLDSPEEARRIGAAARDRVDAEYRVDRNWTLLQVQIERHLTAGEDGDAR